jgi:hypothetical protein
VPWPADYQAGLYTLFVGIRPVGSAAAYVTYTTIPFTLTGCTVPTLGSDKASPQAATTTVTFTAGATCTGTPQYQFWVQAPSGVWTLVQPWGASNQLIWASPATKGVYHIEVWFRNAGAIEDPFDTYTLVAFTLT